MSPGLADDTTDDNLMFLMSAFRNGSDVSILQHISHTVADPGFLERRAGGGEWSKAMRLEIVHFSVF